MSLRTVLLALPVLFLPAMAMAEDNERQGFTLGPVISTLGAGAEAGWRMSDHWGVRGNGTVFSFSHEQEIDDIDYDLDFKLRSAGATADLYPFKGGFRISAGGRYNDNHIDGQSDPASTVEIGGTTYPLGTTVQGKAEYNHFAPYAGIGYDAILGGGFSLGMDIGAMYQGKADVHLTSNNPLVTDADLREAERDVEDELNKYQVYPVASIALLYKF